MEFSTKAIALALVFICVMGGIYIIHVTSTPNLPPTIKQRCHVDQVLYRGASEATLVISPPLTVLDCDEGYYIVLCSNLYYFEAGVVYDIESQSTIHNCNVLTGYKVVIP